MRAAGNGRAYSFGIAALGVGLRSRAGHDFKYRATLASSTMNNSAAIHAVKFRLESVVGKRLLFSSALVASLLPLSTCSSQPVAHTARSPLYLLALSFCRTSASPTLWHDAMKRSSLVIATIDPPLLAHVIES